MSVSIKYNIAYKHNCSFIIVSLYRLEQCELERSTWSILKIKISEAFNEDMCYSRGIRS